MQEQTTSSESVSKVSVGSGIEKVRVEAAEAAPEVPALKEELDAKGQTKWSDTPTLADQWRSHPKTCRKLAPEVKIFKLNDPEELKEFNTLLKASHPPEAPQIILHTQEQTHEGSWSILARFQKLQYKVLLATK